MENAVWGSDGRLSRYVAARKGSTLSDEQPARVSVVIPCFNTKRFLRRAIDSVLSQDYPHVECIVVDGGSADGTIEILQSYGNKIRWVSEPDNGHADAINKGWQMSSGEILTWLNADDLWAGPTVVSQAAAYMAEHPDVDVLYGDCGVVDEHGELVDMAYVHPWDLEYSAVYADHCIPQPASFIRRHALEQVGWLDTNIFTKDRELWLRLGLNGKLQYEPMLLAHASNEEGISFDGPRVAPAIADVTRKFFSLPGVPAKIRRRKRRAMSNAYARAAWYAWCGGRHWALMRKYTVAALVTDPTNVKSIARDYVHYVAALFSDGRHGRSVRMLGLAWRGAALIKRELPAVYSGDQSLRRSTGSRDVEWGWVVAEMPCGPGRALELSRGGSFLSLVAAQRGFNTTVVDRTKGVGPFQHPDVRFLPIQALRAQAIGSDFDLIVNCYGLLDRTVVGKYGLPEWHDQDPESTMTRLLSLLRPGGTLLFTCPVVAAGELLPDSSIVSPERLRRLLSPFEVTRECYWRRSEGARWVWSPIPKEEALTLHNARSKVDSYPTTLGCFVLRRPLQETQ